MDKPNQQKHQEPAATGGNVPGEADVPLHGHGHADHAGAVAPPSRRARRRFPPLIRFPTCPEETAAKNNTLFLFQSSHRVNTLGPCQGCQRTHTVAVLGKTSLGTEPAPSLHLARFRASIPSPLPLSLTLPIKTQKTEQKVLTYTAILLVLLI